MPYSIKLQQAIRLALDTEAMRNSVVRRIDIAEQVYRQVRDDAAFWSEADRRAASVNYLAKGVTEAMNETMTEDYLRAHLPHVPRQYQYLLDKTPTYICVNAAAGHHVLAVKATKEDWAANARMKRSIGEAVIVHADRSNDIYLALTAAGANTLEELSQAQTS